MSLIKYNYTDKDIVVVVFTDPVVEDSIMDYPKEHYTEQEDLELTKPLSYSIITEAEMNVINTYYDISRYDVINRTNDEPIIWMKFRKKTKEVIIEN